MSFVPGTKKALWVAIVSLLCCRCLPGADLSSANRDCLARFWAAAEERTGRVTVMSFGDSMADSYRSMSMVLMDKFVERLGIAGYALNNYRNTLMLNLTGGSQFVGPSRFWYTGHVRLPSGGGVWWKTESSPDGLWCNRVGLFYIAYPEGGAMTLSVSKKGGPWTSVLSLEGCTSSPVGRYAHVDLPLDFYRLRVDSLNGVNYVVGPQLLNTQSSGVQVVFNDEGGLELNQVTNVPIDIRAPIFRALLPDLLIWHMKEADTNQMHNGLLENERWWSSAVPTCDVLYIGSPWVSFDTNTTYSIDRNAVLRANALTFRRAYFDCLPSAVSYPWMVAQGYMEDAVHVNFQGSTYLAKIAWNEMGFFALRRPRTLYLEQAPGIVRLTYQTATGVLYTVESSTNLLHWESLSSLPGTGLPVQTNFPAEGPERVFRLRLSPGL